MESPESNHASFVVDHEGYEKRSSKRYSHARLATYSWVGFWIFAAFIVADKPLHNFHLNEIGDFLAGVFAPVAFFWLVVGYLQQGDELKLTRDEIARQARELENSVKHQKTIADMARETYLQDIEDRRRRNDIEKKQAQPRFAVVSGEFTGQDGTVTPPHDSFYIALTNVSKACWNLYAEISDVNWSNDALFDSPSVDDPLEFLPGSKSNRVTFSVKIPPVFLSSKNDIKIRLHYVDQLMEQTWVDMVFLVDGFSKSVVLRNQYSSIHRDQFSI